MRSVFFPLFTTLAVIACARSTFASVAAADTDPLAPLKAENPQAYEIVHALLLKSQLGQMFTGLHGGASFVQTGAAPVDPLLELKLVNPKAYGIVKALLMQSKMGILMGGVARKADLSFIQAAPQVAVNDPLAPLKAVDPGAYRLVKALLIKSKLGLIYGNHRHYTSLIQLTSDPLAPLLAADPKAYALVKALLLKSKLGGMMGPVALIQKGSDDVDPLTPLKLANPSAYAIVKALLAKSQLGLNFNTYRHGTSLIQTGATDPLTALVSQLEPVKATDPEVYKRVCRLLLSQDNLSLVEVSSKETTLPAEVYGQVKAFLKTTFLGRLFLQAASHTSHLTAAHRAFSSPSLSGEVDPLAPLKLANPKAYAIVKALLAKNDLKSAFSGVASTDRPYVAFIEKSTPHLSMTAQTRLQEVLHKLHSLDARAFAAVEGALNGSDNTAALESTLKASASEATSLLQTVLRDTHPKGTTALLEPSAGQAPSDLDVVIRLEKLGPILKKLARLDQRKFGALTNAVQSIQAPPKGDDDEAFVQTSQATSFAKSMTKESARMLAGLAGGDRAALATKMSASPLETMEKLAPLMEKIAAMDPAASRILEAAIAQVQTK